MVIYYGENIKVNIRLPMLVSEHSNKIIIQIVTFRNTNIIFDFIDCTEHVNLWRFLYWFLIKRWQDYIKNDVVFLFNNAYHILDWKMFSISLFTSYHWCISEFFLFHMVELPSFLNLLTFHKVHILFLILFIASYSKNLIII